MPEPNICEVCGTHLVCPKCNPAKKRALTVQAQAVDDCIQAYLAAWCAIFGKPYPGKPPCGAVVRWLGQQASRDKGVLIFKQAVSVAVEAHKIDPVGKYSFPQRVPLFVSLIPDILGNWLERAGNVARIRREIAAKQQGLEPSPTPPPLSPDGLKRRQCLDSLKASGQKCRRDKPYCGDGGCGAEIREELPGQERYSPGPARRTGRRFDNPGFARMGDLAKKMVDGMTGTEKE